MKRLNKLSLKFGFMKKPKFSDQLVEAVQRSPKVQECDSVLTEESASRSISTPVFDKLFKSAKGEERTRFLDAMTDIAGPIHASELREFPTLDCLTPEEVYEKDKLGDERLAHLERCSWCQTMVSGSHASPEEAAAWRRDMEPKVHTRQRVAGRGRSAL
jgi:hypothetical protein